MTWTEWVLQNAIALTALTVSILTAILSTVITATQVSKRARASAMQMIMEGAAE